MNNNQRQGSPGFHSPHHHHHHHHHHQQQNANPTAPRWPPPAPPVATDFRPRPPSMSRAPWDVTNWVDPVQNQRR